MASGRKNRGSRHRSHRHKQQKGDDSGDSDTEQNLRHGPNPYPNSSSPWTMEPLPPNVEGPSVLKQPDMENVDRDPQHVSQGSTAKRRKENLTNVGDTASVMDRWDGGGGADEAATLSFLGVTERSSIVLGDGFSRKEPRGETEGKNMKGKIRATPAVSSSKGLDHADSNPTDISGHSIVMTEISRDFRGFGSSDGNLAELSTGHTTGFDASESAKARLSRGSNKEKESEDAGSLANTSGDTEKKRSRRSDSSQKSKRSEAVGTPSAVESKEEHHSVLEKGTMGVFQDVVRNLELEKELESRIRRRSEGSGDRDRWRDGGREREMKGSRFHAEELYQNDMRLKDEKLRQENAKDDSIVKTGRERSSSRHRVEGWKPGRHLEDKQKEEDLHVGASREGWLKHEKDHEQRRKSDKGRGDRSIEVKGKDDKLEEGTSSRDDLKNTRNKDLFKDAKERDGRATESRHKENRSKDSRYRDDKARDFRSKIEVGVVEDRRLTSENIKREYPSQEKEEKLTFDIHQDDVKRESDKAKEDRPKLKDRSAKFYDSVKDEKEKFEKPRDEGAIYMKNKNEKRKGELEQEDSFRQREDSAFDAVDGRGKKRSEREQDHSTKYSKRPNEEGDIDKQQDDKDRDEIQKPDTHIQRESLHVNGKQAENSAKFEARHDLNDRDGHSRDTWLSGDRRFQENIKEDGIKHSKRRDESQERRWGGGIPDERVKNSKEFYDRQKQSREMDDRQRYGLFNMSKQRGERGKDDRKQTEKLKEDKHEEMPVPVFERLGGAKESNRRNDGGEKDSRRNNLEKGYEQFLKKSKDLDGQSKAKIARDPIETRGSKGYATNKGDRTVSKVTRSTSQDQERILSVAGAKDATATENLSKRNLESDTFDLVDRDFARPRGRPIEESSSLLHEDRPLHEKSVRKSKFEISVSSSIGTRRPRETNWQSLNHADQGKSYPGIDEEVRSWEPRVSNQDSDDERRRPYNHERTREPLSPRGPLSRGHEDFVRGPESIHSKDAVVSKRKHDNFSQGAVGSTKHRRVDDASGERLDCSHQGTPGNRPPTNRHLGSLALLPPPPPYRPGVDNPTVMGAPSNFVETSSSRDSGRYDRKVGGGHSRRSEMVGPGDNWGGFGMGNWNAHNQGPVPGPGSLFPSFPQIASGFLGMGQQFHVPQVFGPNGSRPVNMGFGGGRFRMGDGGAGFPGHASDHGHVMGWHRFSDGSESHRPHSGFMHTWEGSGRYPDERKRFAHPEWDQFSQGLSAGGWEGVSEPWQGQIGDANFDVNSHRQREDLYQAQREDASWPESETDKIQGVEDDMLVETAEIAGVGVNDVTEKFVSKASKLTKERMQMFLLHARVCADLVDPELYKEFLSLLPPSEAKKREASLQNQAEVSPLLIDEDLGFEVDSEAQDLLLSQNSCATLLPTLSENVHKSALKVFQRPVQQNRVQKSLVGSFLLPKSLSEIPGLILNKETMKGNGGATLDDQERVLVGSACGAQNDIAGVVETVDTKFQEKSLCVNTSESCDGALADTDLAGHGGEDGSSVLSGDQAIILQPGCIPVRNLGGEEPCPVNEMGKVSADYPNESQVAENDQLTAQHKVSLSCPPLLGVQQEAEKEQLLEDSGIGSEALAFSSRKIEELKEGFERVKSAILDDPKGKHRHQVTLESAHAIIP